MDSPKRKKYKLAWSRKPETKAKIKIYLNSPKVQERLKKYRRKSEVREKMRLESRKRRQTLEHKKWRKKYMQTPKMKRYSVYYRSIRRAREKGAEGSYSLQEWLSLIEKYNFECLSCKRKEPEIKLTHDHVIPLTKGGTNYITNMQPLCVSCNSKKHDQIIDYR